MTVAAETIQAISTRRRSNRKGIVVPSVCDVALESAWGSIDGEAAVFKGECMLGPPEILSKVWAGAVESSETEDSDVCSGWELNTVAYPEELSLAAV